ncbi:MAG: hypothetical protein JO206_03195, partial [Solirubrobacterales bacterium]|nr:hypothetical protein [Solirubrobacterales bacterium]
MVPFRGKVEPPLLQAFVSRRDLTQLLGRESRKLTVIRAPAGWGKTTLLGDWSSSLRPDARFAWLRLDAADNDRDRFWLYLVEALRTVIPRIGEAATALALAPGVSLVHEALPALVAEIAAGDGELILAMDDYHLIESPAINEAMAWLVEYGPANLRLVLATRTEPDLPLARLRVRGELTEVGVDDLRFSEAETEALVNGLHCAELDRDVLALLRARTEGWAAGLYLAVLSLHRGADARALISSFAGDDRQIVDYLGSEVLADQPAAIRSFLLRSSILDRFCAPLCQAVTGASNAGELLEHVQRSNYFLVSLDSTGEWYRYHHLFGDMLRRLLEREAPDEVTDLHRVAADWFRDAGLESEAIHHSVAAGDVAAAGELIASSWLRLVSEGKRTAVLGWLEQLGRQAVLADARLCSAQGWTRFSMGRLEEVGPWADAADQALLTNGRSDSNPGLATEIVTLRASHELLSGDVEASVRWSREALRLGAEGAWHAVALLCLGTASYWLGDAADATEQLRE